MKIINLLVIGLVFFSLACSDTTAQVELKTKQDSLAYAIGNQWGKNLKTDDLILNTDLIKQGIDDSFKDAAKLTDEQIQSVLMTLQSEIQEKRMKQQQEAASSNIKKAEAFMAANKSKEGVLTTASGLQYKVLKAGTGKSPVATDKVEVHYHGTLTDGSVFDSSVERGEPITFPLNGVIPGWTEGLQLMKEGGKVRFFIPPALAYGAQGSGAIGPNEVLIFDVDLLKVNPTK
ncbi:MAG: FKBP-type peptidyl-prolyl cis-trans isomerase [Candidatus Kapaibacterium sp.]